ncbi:MAG: hypothetical protein WAK84_06225 [Candidatus Cybelea sp.]
MRGRIGEILYVDDSGSYSVPIELASGSGTNFSATDAIEVDTGRWVVGERAVRILEKINEGFIQCDGVQMSIGKYDWSSLDSPKSRFVIGDREVTYEEWVARAKSRSPKTAT